jgi:hypothetical protein
MSYAQVFLSILGFPGFPGKRQSCQKNIYPVHCTGCTVCAYINVVSNEKKELRGVKIYLIFIRVKSAKN